MIIGRIIGWVLLALGFMVLGHDTLNYFNVDEWHSILLGELWFMIDPEGLNFTQAIIQRYLLPSLWDPVITTVLLWSAWADFIVPGALFLILFRRRKKAAN